MGQYEDAFSLLRKVRTGQLSREGLAAYYHALSHVYGEVAYYSKLETVQYSCYALSGRYEGLLLSVLDRRTAAYNEALCHSLFAKGHYHETLHICDKWGRIVDDRSREYAMVAYYRFLIHIALGDVRQVTYWVARSTVSDITHAVMNQGSLWTLAGMLSEKDIDRSYRYIRFSWTCAQTFGAHLRASQISPILSSIGDEYQVKLAQANQRLKRITVMISLLAIVPAILALLCQQAAKKTLRCKN